MASPLIDGILVSDSIEIDDRYCSDKRLAIIPVAALFADAIAQSYETAAG